MKKTIIVLVAVLFFFFLTCSRGNADASSSSQIRWQTITANEAYRIMQETENYILLDVRTEAEFQQRHIQGAILIPDFELRNRAALELPDKNAVILIYCHAGRRSATSAALLAELGYTNIFDSGGIINWP